MNDDKALNGPNGAICEIKRLEQALRIRNATMLYNAIVDIDSRYKNDTRLLIGLSPKMTVHTFNICIN